MWRTRYGNRTLKGNEAVVFAEALWSLLDGATAKELDEYELGVESFDNLTFGQKISALSIVGNGLLRKDVPIVPLTAVLEGAIAAVFENLKNEITFEINTHKLHLNWRELVIAARKEMRVEEIPESTCTDFDEWDSQVDTLAEAILLDRDYYDAILHIYFTPERSDALKSIAGITDDYFLAIPDDLTGYEAQIKIRELKNLCNLIIKSS